jgi:hypothetical protein
LKKLTEKSLQDLESYSWVTLSRTSSWADFERTPPLVIKTVQSVQVIENEIYDEYVYVKPFVTGGVPEWTANKTMPTQRWVEMVSHFTKIMFHSQMYLSYQSSFSAFLEPMLPLKEYFSS